MSENKNNSIAVVVGLSINALSIIRSLGRKSINVISVYINSSDYVSKSKYSKVELCDQLYGKELVKKLIKIGKSIKKRKVLFCTSDLSVLTVSKYRQSLDKYYYFVLPPDNIVKILMNKRLFYEFAQQNSFNVPKTHFVGQKNDINFVGHATNYPCLIKPEYRDMNWEMNVSKIDKVLYLKSKSDFFRLFKNFNIVNNPVVVQEWIDGNDEDVFYCLTYINRNHEPIAVFTGKKLRQFPILTGSTSMAESKWMPNIAEASLRLLKTSDCIGICSVEFKYSKKKNAFFITEPTVGRTDTQEGSSIVSGLDIPYIAYLDALGYNPRPITKFQNGIKWINEPEEYNSARAYLKNNKLRYKQLIGSYRGKRTYALYANDDPLPFIVFLLEKLTKIFTKFLNKKILGSKRISNKDQNIIKI